MSPATEGQGLLPHAPFAIAYGVRGMALRLRFAVPLLLACLLVCACQQARAHAVLIGHWPATSQILDQAPENFILEFNEGVQPLRFGLFDGQGKQYAVIAPPPGRSARLVLHPVINLPPGPYLLSYRVTSADGHPVAGGLLFQFGTHTEGSAALGRLRQAAEIDIWRLPVLAARSLVYAGLLFGAGGAFALCLIRPNPPVAGQARRVALAACGTALVLLIPFHLLVAGQLLGAAPAELLFRPAWALLVSGPHSANLATALAGLAILILGLLRDRQPPPAWTLLGALAVAISFILAGHAASAEPRWAVRAVLLVHVSAAGFWLGSLPMLLLSVVRLGVGAAPILKRFAGYAVLAVSAVLACGACLTWVQTTGDLATLWTTPYGERLGFKLAAVAGLLAVAATNRFVLTPRLAATAQSRLLAGLLGLDLILAVLVVSATASLNMDPPPRITRMPMGQDVSPLAAGLLTRLAPLSGGRSGRQESVAVSFAPSSAARSSVVLDYFDPDGRLLPAQDAVLTLALPDRSIEGLHWHARPDATGRLRAETVTVPFAGEWTLTVEIFIDDFTRRVFQGKARFEQGVGAMAGMPGMETEGAPATAISIDGNKSPSDTSGPRTAGMDGMMMSDLNGADMNGDADRLPIDCPSLAGDQSLVVHVGRRYAQPSTTYGYDRTVWAVPGCTRVNLTLVNDDHVRHQFMMHGLPRYLYPQGMLHVEAEGGTSRFISFIIPSTPRTYFVHCDMAQHTEKGLKAELKGAGGSGDLPNIPGFTGPVVSLVVPVRWSDAQLATFGGGVALSAILLLLATSPLVLLRRIRSLSRGPFLARLRAPPGRNAVPAEREVTH